MTCPTSKDQSLKTPSCNILSHDTPSTSTRYTQQTPPDRQSMFKHFSDHGWSSPALYQHHRHHPRPASQPTHRQTDTQSCRKYPLYRPITEHHSVRSFWIREDFDSFDDTEEIVQHAGAVSTRQLETCLCSCHSHGSFGHCWNRTEQELYQDCEYFEMVVIAWILVVFQ